MQSLLQQTALQQNVDGSSTNNSSCTVDSTTKRRRKSIAQIRLHVQTSNEDAIRFYTQRFGFVHDGTIMTNYYYPRLDPPDCYVLSKPVLQLLLPRDDDGNNYPNEITEVHNDESNPDTTTTMPLLPTTAAEQVVTSPDPDPNNKKRTLPRDDEEASTSSSSTPSSCG